MEHITRLSKDELLGLHDKLTIKAHDIMVRKNQDYTGGSDDPFANFRGSLAMGVEPEIGLMIRMTDKLQRAKSFVANGMLAVEDEGIEDIGADLINYAVLLTGLMMERQLEKLDLATAPDAPVASVPEDGGFELGDSADEGPKASTKTPAAKDSKGGSKK